jgi:hypothetical protein
VLCADASKIGREEFYRASLLLGEMSEFEPVAVAGEMNCTGAPNLQDVWVAPGTELALLAAKDPGAWTRDDARTAAANLSPWAPMVARGLAATLAAPGNEAATMAEMEWMAGWSGYPFGNTMGMKEDLGGKFIPAARLLLEMLRAGEFDGKPEPLITGAWWNVAWMMMQSPAVAADQLEAGFLDVAMSVLQRYNPMERIGLRCGNKTPLFFWR